MILDAENLFSNGQAVTATANSTNVVDLGAAGTPWLSSTALVRNIHFGTEIPVLIQVGTAFTAAGAATMNVQLVTSAAAALSTPTVLWAPPAVIAVATLVAGYTVYSGPLPSPAGGAPMLRYIGVIYTVATGPMTAGNIDAGFVAGVDSNL